MNEIIYSVGAIITSLGGGALIVAAFSAWLGKVWAARILEKDRLKYQSEMEVIKSELNKRLHEHNVAIKRIDAQRAEAVQKIYAALLEWFEAVLEILAPTRLNSDIESNISKYRKWAKATYEKSVCIQKTLNFNAILLTEGTYEKVSKCGISASDLSIKLCDAVFNQASLPPDKHLDSILTERKDLEKKYEDDFEPAKKALISEFRAIMDPSLRVKMESS